MYFTTIISLVTATIGAVAAPVARDDTSILDQATKVLDQLNDDLQDITLGISTYPFTLLPCLLQPSDMPLSVASCALLAQYLQKAGMLGSGHPLMA